MQEAVGPASVLRALELALALAATVSSPGCSAKSGPTGTSGSETTGDACSDAADNDGDGLVDCAEPSCTVYAWCAPMPGVDSGLMRPDTGPARDAGPPLSCNDPIDVTFVIDVSTSMEDEVDGIRAGVASIWAAARALTAEAQFTLVVFVDDVMLVNGCMPFDTVDALQGELERWRAFCSTNHNPVSGATNTDCPENSVDALYAAATSCPWREGATRVLIHVTDDTFAERPTVLSQLFGVFGGVPVQHTYAEAIDALTAAEIRVGVFAAPGAGEYCGAGTSPNVGQGFFEAYMGMEAIPVRTGGQVWSIRDVRNGTLDMAEAINTLIMEEHCTLY